MSSEFTLIQAIAPGAVATRISVEHTVIRVSGHGGPRGSSAYQIALDNGFVGTEEEWLESLIPGLSEIPGIENFVQNDDSRLSDERIPVDGSVTSEKMGFVVATPADLAAEVVARNAAISTAVNNLINGAPGALDTITELAAALGNDPNAITSLTNAIAAKMSTADANATFLAIASRGAANGVAPLDANGRLPLGYLATTQTATSSRFLRGDGQWSSVGTSSVADDAVTNVKLANMATGTVKANITGASADPADVTLAAFKVALAIAYGDISGTPTLGTAAAQNVSAFEPAGAVAAEATARQNAISAAINALIGSAPGTLDTLNELADALGDDPNFAATVNAAIAARLTQAQADALYDAIGSASAVFGNLDPRVDAIEAALPGKADDSEIATLAAATFSARGTMIGAGGAPLTNLNTARGTDHAFYEWHMVGVPNNWIAGDTLVNYA